MCSYVFKDAHRGTVKLTPPIVIEDHKTLQPTLYRIKGTIMRKSIPESLGSLLKS